MPTADAISHLFKRAGFGLDLETIQQKSLQPLETTVEELLDDFVEVEKPTFLDDASLEDWEREYLLRHWWLDRMAGSTKPLQEKLTLFWHGHFATENSKVNDVRLMWDQNNLFRTSGMGNFRELVQNMSLQAAMVLYLDNAYNHKSSPNENFARELLELFTLGVNQYSQADVITAARAWTGHNINDSMSPMTYEFHSTAHDFGTKEFMGESRAWDGPQIIDYLLEENLATKMIAARHITRKLWVYFAGSTPPEAVIDELSHVFFDSDLNIKDLLRAVFLRPEFYGRRSRNGLVRNPTEWVVAIMKATHIPMTDPGDGSDHFHAWGMDEMGMELFQPPNVAGWKNNAYWLGTTQHWARASWIWNYRWTLHEANFLFSDVQEVLDGPGGDARYELAVDNALAKFGIYTPTANTKSVLTTWIKKQYEAPGEWRQRAWYHVTQLITMSPDFMMA